MDPAKIEIVTLRLRILAMHDYLAGTLLFQAKKRPLMYLLVLEPKKYLFLADFQAMYSKYP